MKSLDCDGGFVGRWIETAQLIRLAFPLRVLYCFQPANFPVAASGFPTMRCECLPFGIHSPTPEFLIENLPCVMSNEGIVMGFIR